LSRMSQNNEPLEVPRHLLGTAQYPDATDLSEYIVHLTATAENLANILTTGCIEARRAHGIGRRYQGVRPLHLSVCLTESPIPQLARIADEKGTYGIAFKREFIQRRRGQRVWYLDQGSAPLKHVYDMINSAREKSDWEADVWHVTPFIDQVIPGLHEYTHEREWRVTGEQGLRFEWADIAFILTPDGKVIKVDERPALSVPVPDHEYSGLYEWSDGTLPEIDARMTLLEEEFGGIFINIEDADLPYDRESDDGFADLGFERFETWDAVEFAFDAYPVEVKLALQEHLDRASPSWTWLRSAELREAAEEAEEEHREALRAAGEEVPEEPEEVPYSEENPVPTKL